LLLCGGERELYLRELRFSQKFRLEDERVAGELIMISLLVRETILHLVQGGFHRFSEGLNDMPVNVLLMVSDNGRCAAASLRDFAHKVLVAA